MMYFFAFGFSALVHLADTSSLIATDVIRAGDLVTLSNAGRESGDESIDDSLLGREVKRTVYAGRAITFENTRPAQLVKRNQVVTIKYISGSLEITTTGRAMGAAGLDEPITILNIQSRQQVQGIVQQGGWVLVP